MARRLLGCCRIGERQQLATAVALADPPAVFIADEPSLGLAPLAVTTVMDALASCATWGAPSRWCERWTI